VAGAVRPDEAPVAAPARLRAAAVADAAAVDRDAVRVPAGAPEAAAEPDLAVVLDAVVEERELEVPPGPADDGVGLAEDDVVAAGRQTGLRWSFSRRTIRSASPRLLAGIPERTCD
jgi:hypothetical protein